MVAISMAPIHHAAVGGPTRSSALNEGAEYRPFSGYGGYSKNYPRVMPWRGYSTVPHHVAVESHDVGVANGRIFYKTSETWVSPQRAERLRAPREFNMYARHAALVPQAPPMQPHALLVDLPYVPERRAARAKSREAVPA